ncbi:MAG: ResB protein required for cytochrome C biosynthesis [Verrucomicrobia bacterium]|nr:MAG: ResB protein required for cytochrome C biosynthesis [Verrucomicrobiota bacterium]
MFDRLFRFFTSLRLTVVLLAFGIVLVFVGTVAQADEGLYNAQARYFKHWFVRGITMFGHRIPIGLPGGYLIGTLLLINLVAAHIKRFQLTTKKIGIQLTHAGVILLLVGQLTTDLFSRETQIRFSEGQTRSYAESGMNYELAFITDADADTEEVVAIPARLLAKGAELKHEKLPFTVHVKYCWLNSDPSFRAPMMQNEPPVTTNGLARSFDFRPAAETKSMDSKNVPTALIEVVAPSGSLGAWVVSGWAGDDLMVEALSESFSRQMGEQMAASIISRLTEPQTVEAGGKQFAFVLRPARVYEPYSLTLLKATHSIYRGTDIPKDFRSRVRLENHQTGENREVEIFMNSPLRYEGQTFYQYQMVAGELARRAGQAPSSILQVVRNPSWLTPYAGCIMVAAGLVTQFMIHLVGFVSRRKTA